MPPYLKTCEICKLVPISAPNLQGLIRRGALTGLAKDGSGDYVWTADDVARIRAAQQIDRRCRGGLKKKEVVGAAPQTAAC